MKSSSVTHTASGSNGKGAAEGEILKEKLRLLEAKQKELRKKVRKEERRVDPLELTMTAGGGVCQAAGSEGEGLWGSDEIEK
jgi:hypothetical protein